MPQTGKSGQYLIRIKESFETVGCLSLGSMIVKIMLDNPLPFR